MKQAYVCLSNSLEQTKSALVDGLVDDRCFVYLSIRINVLCSGVIVSGVCFFFVVVMT